MAQHVETSLIDDLSGGPADETVTFTPPGGKPREIDLSTANADAFREMFAPYVEKSRAADVPAPRRSSGGSNSGGRTNAGDRARNLAIRAWGREQYGADSVAERGRVPADLLEAHAKAGYPATSGRADGDPTAKYVQPAAPAIPEQSAQADARELVGQP